MRIIRVIAAAGLAVGLLGLLAGGEAKAQMMPNWGAGLNGIIQQNQMFDQQMQQQADQAVQAWLQQRMAYRLRTGDWGYLPGPVSAMDLSRSIGELNNVYQGYNDAAFHNSQVTDEALRRWSQAYRGYGDYVDPYSGTTYELPNNYGAYNIGDNGSIYPGYLQGNTNLYPYYGYGY